MPWSSWSTPVADYCERTDPGFWAEPANAASNLAFLIAAAMAYRRWRRAGGDDAAALGLIVIVVAVGVGSFVFHTLATRGAMLLDVGPIAVFIHGYLLLALRRFLRLAVLIAVGVVLAFATFSALMQMLTPVGWLGGSSGYLPALGAMIFVGVSACFGAWDTPAARTGPHDAGAARIDQVRARAAGRMLLTAAAVFAVSLTLRSIDMAACDVFPRGTHFIWHLLNATVLYRLTCGAVDWRHDERSRSGVAVANPGRDVGNGDGTSARF